MEQTLINQEVDAIYLQPEGSLVHIKFRVQRKDVPSNTNFETNVLSLIRQATFAETYIAKTAGRELTFKPAIVDMQKEWADVMVEGELGAFIGQ